MNNNRGFIQILGPILVLIAILGGGYIYYQQNYAKPINNTPVVDSGSSSENTFDTNYQPPKPIGGTYVKPTTPAPAQPVNTQANNPPSQTSENKKGAIISLVVNPCRQEQYSCVYAYGAKAVMLGKNITSATMKSSGTSGSGAVPFDDVIGKMAKVSESVNGDRWESTVPTRLQGIDSFYIEAKDSEGNIFKSEKLHLQYESASNLTIVSPQRNEELQRGSSKEISWTISNSPKNSWVRIDIAKVPESGQSLSLQEAQVLVKMVPSDSSFVWNIPSSLEARRYEMRVDLYGEASNFDTLIIRNITDFIVK